MAIFTDVLLDVTKNGRKLPTNEYKEFGLHPIIDQGQNDIAGYTDETNGLFSDVPAIIFGDHTRVIKYVDVPFFIGADGVKILKAKGNKANYKFLYYALSSAKIPNTGYNRHFKWLKEVDIPTYTEREQSQIVSELDRITALIDLRTEQLNKLDQLVKSRFVELFGDPMDNPMGWDRVNISAVVGGKVSNGFFAKRDDYCDDGNVKVLGVAHVVNRMYSNTEDLPTTNGTETDVAKYSVKYGDMLFCRSSLVAAGIGKASIVPQGTPNNVLFECHVIRLPLDLDKCVPEFMQVLSTTEYFRNQVIAQSKTATMTTIGQDGILKTDIILPPLEMQKQFLQFVEQTDKSKLAVQQSLEKLEILKKSLMQQYFG